MEGKIMIDRLSVLMSVRSGNVNDLMRSISSILNQSHSNFEFIIVDDENTDFNIISLLRDLSILDNRLKVDRCKHYNLANALNFGLEKTTNDLILRMDADDYAYPELIEKQLEFFNNYPEAVICGVQANIKNGEIEFQSNHPEIITKELAKNMDCWIANHPGIAFKKEIAFMLDGYEVSENFAVDYPLWCKFLMAGYTLYNLPDVLIDYYVNENSYSQKNKDNQNNTKWLEEWRNKL